jgi:hypothetical protein
MESNQLVEGEVVVVAAAEVWVVGCFEAAVEIQLAVVVVAVVVEDEGADKQRGSIAIVAVRRLEVRNNPNGRSLHDVALDVALNLLPLERQLLACCL